MSDPKGLFGKYRGTVSNNVDPLCIGRIQAVVPDATGLVPTTWAMPCFPVTGMFMVPSIGAGVWVEFERGDVGYPIWTGCFYGSSAEVPALAQKTPPGVRAVTVQLSRKVGLTVTDLPGPQGGITLQSASGATVVVSDTGIVLSSGQGATITLTGPAVDVNNGALSVV